MVGLDLLDQMVNFAAAESASGIGAFNINWKSLIFQLVTFVIVLLIFRRWILPPIVKTLEYRRQALEKSLADAKATEETLARAETQAEELLAKARAQADEVLAEARKSAEAVIAEAETAAVERSAAIITEAEARLDQERIKLREAMREELSGLVAEATEKVVADKVDNRRDQSLITRAIRSIAG